MDHWSSKSFRDRARVLSSILLAAIFIAAVVYIYSWKYLSYDPLNVPVDGYELKIAPGTSVRQFIKQLHAKDLLSHPNLMIAYVALTQANHIQAGEYKVDRGTTPLQLLANVEEGLVAQYSFTIVEGWQTAQLLMELRQHPKIKYTLNNLSTDEIIQKLNIPVKHLEGIFLPDTYLFPADTTDIDFLRRAYFSMEMKLRNEWPKRSAECKAATPYEALILASIIEKESGLKNEYTEISGVYSRRLAKNMKLQADPTVIYAYQDQLTGTLSRKHLRIDSPYNTYKKYGLPPTPIALPSAAAIEAALHPAPGNSLYFVATGDGGHVFSSTLKEHNAAVKQLYAKKN